MIEKQYIDEGINDNNITETIVRTRALLLNEDNILLGCQNGVLHFPGGHLDKGETLKECLAREILEEAGIEIEDNEIEEPFYKVTYYSKDWPTTGNNRKSEFYYFVVKTNKEVDLSKTYLTQGEIDENFKIVKYKLNEVIDKINECIKNIKEDNRTVFLNDMITILNVYFENQNNKE